MEYKEETELKENEYRCWKKWMELGEKTGCHQKPDRSFYIRGYQMPVCARCFGVIIGYLAAVPCFFLIGFSLLFSLLGSLVMFADWIIQEAGVKKSTNIRRLVTGIAGGFGIMSLQLHLLKSILQLIGKARKLHKK
jgi:uncharacterized membrane protein